MASYFALMSAQTQTSFCCIVFSRSKFTVFSSSFPHACTCNSTVFLLVSAKTQTSCCCAIFLEASLWFSHLYFHIMASCLLQHLLKHQRLSFVPFILKPLTSFYPHFNGAEGCCAKGGKNSFCWYAMTMVSVALGNTVMLNRFHMDEHTKIFHL